MSATKNGTTHVVTQRDVAEACGLSLMTVSRILRNDRKMFKPETVEKVLKAASELDYDPSRSINARRLRYAHKQGAKVENQLVAMCISLRNVEGQYFYRLLHGISEVLDDAGFSLLTNWAPRDETVDVPIPSIFERGEVDGVLALSGYRGIEKLIKKLRDTSGFADRPIVTMMEQEAEGCCVLVDDFGGGRAIMAHLLSLGHRKLFYVNYGRWQHEQRIKGCRQACRDEGEDPDQVMVPLASASGKSKPSRESLLLTLKKHPDGRAIFAGNDLTACEIAGWLGSEGYGIPDHFSLVGFDDTHSIPGPGGENMLTTVRAPLEQVGERAAELLLQRIRGGVGRDRVYSLPVELIVRASTSPPVDLPATP